MMQHSRLCLMALSVVALTAVSAQAAPASDGASAAAAAAAEAPSLQRLCALAETLGLDAAAAAPRWWAAASVYLVQRGARPGTVFDGGAEGLGAVLGAATAAPPLRALPPLSPGGEPAGLYDGSRPRAAADAAALAKRSFWLDEKSPELGRLLGLPRPHRGQGRWSASVYGEALTAWESRFLELEEDRRNPAGALWGSLAVATYPTRRDCAAALAQLAAQARAWHALLAGQQCGELAISRVFAAGCGGGEEGETDEGKEEKDGEL